MTWAWVKDHRNFILEWTVPLKLQQRFFQWRHWTSGTETDKTPNPFPVSGGNLDMLFPVQTSLSPDTLTVWGCVWGWVCLSDMMIVTLDNHCSEPVLTRTQHPQAPSVNKTSKCVQAHALVHAVT